MPNSRTGKPSKRALTPKMRKFCEAYVGEAGYNQSEAYRIAYPDAKTKSKADASRLFAKPEIKEYIAQLQKEAFERAMITPEKVANRLNEIAFDEDPEKLSYALQALKLLQTQMGLDKKVIEAKGIDINITLNDNDTDKS